MQVSLAFDPHISWFLSKEVPFSLLPPMGGGLRLGPRKCILSIIGGDEGVG